MKQYLIAVFFDQYFLLFVTAALGAAIGKIKIKDFSLGSAAGIFAGIFVGWLMTSIAKTMPDNTAVETAATGVVAPQAFMTFFLLLFIAAVGLSCGGKIKHVLRHSGVKIVIISVIIPVISMVMTIGCMKIAPSLMGDSSNAYQMSGLYSGAMTNTASFGTSLEVVGSMDNINERYQALSDQNKTAVLKLIEAQDTTPTEGLNEGQISAFIGKAKSSISLGYAIGFPVGTIVIILAMSIISASLRKKKPEGDAAVGRDKNRVRPGLDKPFFYSAVIFGLVILIGMLIGNIQIPLGHNITFSLSSVGGVLISALAFSNFKKIGRFDMIVNPKTLAFLREFACLFFMTVVGLNNGYKVIDAFTSSGLILAIMAVFIEGVAILIAFILGRYIFKLNWGILSGAICGGCTSATGLGSALSAVGTDEPAVGYGVAQPFAILANIILISLFHSNYFI